MTTETKELHPTVKRIQGLMVRHDLNQPKMERLLGVSHGTLGNWLTGARNPNQVVARLLSVIEEAELFHGTFFLSLLAQARDGKSVI